MRADRAAEGGRGVGGGRMGGHQAGKRRGSSPRHQTDEDRNANPFPSSRALPLRPLLLLRHPPPPATARIQSLHINPAHNSHFPVWATLRLRLPRYPLPTSLPPPPSHTPVERAKGNQNKQGKEEPVRRWAEKGGKGIAASYRLGFLSKPGF